MTKTILQQARLYFRIDLGSFKKEADALTGWQAHFNTRQYSGNWTALPLRAPGGEAERIIPDNWTGAGYADTELLDQCPSIKKFLSTLQCPLMSVRLLNLAVGAVIQEHRDQGLAYEQGEARLHIPIYTNKYVNFYVNNSLVPMEEGSCWYINANLPHRVANEGNADRIHLVIDCEVNDWLRAQFHSGEQVFCLPADESTRAVIEELRRQDTPFAQRLADDMERQLLATTS